MASWQFDIDLLPRSKVLELYSAMPESIELEVYENTEWCDGFRLPEDFKEVLDNCLPRNKAWLRDTLEWGTAEGHRVSIGFSRDEVEWITIRIDVGNLNMTLINCLVDFARHSDCLMLLTENLKIIEAIKSNLLKEIETSNAAKFVSNPKAYFDDLKTALLQ